MKWNEMKDTKLYLKSADEIRRHEHYIVILFDQISN